MARRSAVLLIFFAFLAAGALFDVGLAQTLPLANPPLQDMDLPASGSVTVPAKGGVEFSAELNEMGPFPFILDTGAGINILSPAAAKRLGLQIDADPLQVAGVGGYATIHTASVDTFRIGGLVLHHQTFYIMPMPWEQIGGPVGAVGYELLSRLTVRIDYEHRQLTLNDPKSFMYSGPGIKAPLKIVRRSPEVEASINGLNGVFTLDTGNEASLFLEPEFVKRNGLVSQASAHFHGYAGSGAGGSMPPAYYARLGPLRVGDAEVKDTIALLLDGVSGPEVTTDGNIGTGILRQFNLTVDFAHGALYLEKNSNWGKPGVFNRAGIVTDSILQDQKIRNVLPGSPAEIAGARIGDIILKVDGHAPSNDPLEQDDPAFRQPAGTVVRLTLRRGHELRKIRVMLRDMF